jgi:hypothetical protein
LHEPKEPASHAGELKTSEHEAGEVFEFGGHKLLLKGTSGPPEVPSRMAEGRPIRHDVVIAGQAIVARATSGASQVESRVAEGRPVQHRSSAQDAAPGVTGSGQLVGGPVRRA